MNNYVDKRSKGLWTHEKFTGNLHGEYWKPILGYEGIYEVSNLSRVKSLPKVKGRYLQKDSHILSPKINRDGYFCYCLQKEKNKKHLQMQRLMAINFIPNPQNLPQVNHKDGNKLNNLIENLEWCTCQENVRHAWNTGLHKPMNRMDNGNTILVPEQVIEIKRLRDTGKTYFEIAKIFDISFGHVGKICRGDRRKVA
jgi:hypothetical protein